MTDYLTDEWIAQQQQRLDAAYEQVARAIALFGRAGDSLPRLEAALGSAEERLDRLRADLEQARAGLRGETERWLRQLKEEGKNQTEQLGQRLSELLKDLKGLRDQQLLWELRERIEVLKRQWSEAQQEWLEALQDEVAAAETRVREEAAGLHQELSVQLEQLQERLENLSQNLEQEVGERQTLARALDAERSARERTDQELRTLRQDHARLQEELGAQLRRQQELERQLQEQAQALERLSDAATRNQRDNAARLERLEQQVRSLLAWFGSFRGLSRLFRNPQEV